MAKYLLTHAARNDLEAIVDYIAQDSVEAALHVLERIQETFELIAANPGIGHFRSDLTSKPVRFYSVYSYLIVYLDKSEPTMILRVLGSAQDAASILH